MLKKMLALFTAVTAALLVVSVAWAGADDPTATNASTSVSAQADSSIDVTTADSSTTTAGPTSTSAPDATSTTEDSLATSTTSPDGGDDGTTATSQDDDDAEVTVVADGRSTHRISGVGTITIEVTAGMLILIDVSAPGWDIELDKIEHDRIEIEFTSGDSEAEFEAEIKDGRVEIEIEVDSV